MKSVSSAPAKVILFGEHFIVYGGKAILCSINKRIFVESELAGDKIKISSELGTLEVSKDADIKKIDPVFRPIVFLAQKALNQFKSDSGIKISIRSEIPSGVGLGSSSACCVAAASSIFSLFAKLPKEEILKLAIDAEKTVFENTSGADTNICIYGGIMEYTKTGIRKLEFRPTFKIVVANSKIAHSTSQVVSRVKKFKEDHPDVFSTLCDNEATLIEDALEDLKKNDLGSLGKKMLVNQAHLEKIGVSNDVLNSMIESIKNTAYGAKITGAGDGGCIVALVDDKNLEETLRILGSKYECFSADIDTSGMQNQNT
ncbi:MAG TPA: mevalonate kinase [Candidatus Nitrosotenuis sp.]|nr:mevalonate kinase [Candidatus Nitrosotenuis sp.]